MKKLITLTASLAACAALAAGGFANAGSAGWGLSFPNPGEKPTGNADAGALLEYDAYFVGAGDEKVLYLTFDAGYEDGHTGRILDVLKETEVPASFFLVGTYIRDNPELVTRMVDEGHIVANHTMSHPDMSAISNLEAFSKELSRTDEIYKKLTGSDMPMYYRPPRGVYSEENLKMAKELGYKTIFWSLAYADWEQDNQPSRSEAFSKLIPRIHPGAVILLHSTSSTNAEILKDLIGEYRSMGYEFKSLDHLISQDG